MRSFCLRYFPILLFLATPLFPQSLNAGDELNQGALSFRQGKIEAAVQHFKTAVALDDQLVNAHLYLATALATEYVPGADTPDNVQLAEQAISEYKRVLELSPENPSSLRALASLAFNMKKWAEAKEYHRRVIAVDPEDPESYYAIAVIDWTQAFQSRMEMRAKLGLKMDTQLIEKSECWSLRDENEETVKDGIDMLNKALSLRPDYDDAMAYLNLMYRERADIQCGNKAAYEADTTLADEWVDHAMATKKAHAEKPDFRRKVLRKNSNVTIF